MFNFLRWTHARVSLGNLRFLWYTCFLVSQLLQILLRKLLSVVLWALLMSGRSCLSWNRWLLLLLLLFLYGRLFINMSLTPMIRIYHCNDTSLVHICVLHSLNQALYALTSPSWLHRLLHLLLLLIYLSSLHVLLRLLTLITSLCHIYSV